MGGGASEEKLIAFAPLACEASELSLSLVTNSYHIIDLGPALAGQLLVVGDQA